MTQGVSWRLWKTPWRAKATEHEGPQWVLAELAVLLGAGLTPDRAFEEVATRRSKDSIPGQIWVRRHQGEGLVEAIRACVTGQSPAWRTVGAAWEVARVSGAPLGPALTSMAEGLRDQEHTARLVQAELAGPRATLRLVSLLPLLALAGGALGGVDTVSFLFTSRLGLVAVSVGLVCLGLAWWWMRLLVNRVMATRQPPSPRTDLFLVALGGGLPPRAALSEVDRVMAQWDLEHRAEDGLEGLIELSMRAGAPLTVLARAHLKHARQIESVEATRAVGALSVHLVLPLGVLVLPAFLLISVLPLAWGVGSTGLSL